VFNNGVIPSDSYYSNIDSNNNDENRIKVAVRVRPPFDYECQIGSEFQSIIAVINDPPRISLLETDV
jgi:hypothetical protein